MIKWCFLFRVDSGIVKFSITWLLSLHTLVSSCWTSIPNILNLFFNSKIISIAILMATNSSPYVDVSIMFWILECHMIGILYTEISIPDIDLRVILSPSWPESTNYEIYTSLPHYLGAIVGTYSLASGYCYFMYIAFDFALSSGGRWLSFISTHDE